MHPSPPLAPDMCPLLSWLLCLLVLASLAVLPSSTGAQGLAEVVKSLIALVLNLQELNLGLPKC